MQTLADGLKENKVLTDFFFTHNDLQAGGDGGLGVLKSLANKKDLRSLALNSCNVNGEYMCTANWFEQKKIDYLLYFKKLLLYFKNFLIFS